MATKLVPITREYLAKHYESLPIRDPDAVLRAASADLDALAHSLAKAAAMDLPEMSSAEPPRLIDENMFRQAEQFEELMARCARDKLDMITTVHPSVAQFKDAIVAVGEKAAGGLAIIQEHRTRQKARIDMMMSRYIPTDFRGRIIYHYRARGERKAEHAIERLRQANATVKELYDEQWRQQMKRRKMLARLGDASGPMRNIMKVFAGIPQVLLDLAKTINDANGPLEEIRVRYAPFEYEVTTCLYRLRGVIDLLIAYLGAAGDEVLAGGEPFGAARVASSEAAPSLADIGALLVRTVDVIAVEQRYYVDFINIAWDRAPFVLKDYEAGQTLTPEPPKEQLVYARSIERLTFDVPAQHTFAWEVYTANKDIGVGVHYNRIESPEHDLVVLETKRVDTHKTKCVGSCEIPHTATVTIVLDNSFSRFTRKQVYYRTLVAPLTTSGHDDDDGDAASESDRDAFAAIQDAEEADAGADD